MIYSQLKQKPPSSPVETKTVGFPSPIWQWGQQLPSPTKHCSRPQELVGCYTPEVSPKNGEFFPMEFFPLKMRCFFHLKMGKCWLFHLRFRTWKPHWFFFWWGSLLNFWGGVEGFVLAWNRLVCDVRIGPEQNQSPNKCSFCGQELEMHGWTGGNTIFSNKTNHPKQNNVQKTKKTAVTCIKCAFSQCYPTI